MTYNIKKDQQLLESLVKKYGVEDVITYINEYKVPNIENKKEFQPAYTYINAYTDHDKALDAAIDGTLTALIDFTDERVFLPGNSYLRDDDDPDYENGT